MSLRAEIAEDRLSRRPDYTPTKHVVGETPATPPNQKHTIDEQVTSMVEAAIRQQVR